MSDSVPEMYSGKALDSCERDLALQGDLAVRHGMSLTLFQTPNHINTRCSMQLLVWLFLLPLMKGRQDAHAMSARKYAGAMAHANNILPAEPHLITQLPVVLCFER